MSIFGGGLRARNEQLTSELEQSKERVRGLEQELAAARQVSQLEQRLPDAEVVAAARARLAALRQPKRPQAATEGHGPRARNWVSVESNDDEPDAAIYRADYSFQGTAFQLEALELVFAMMATAGEVGSTICFDVMVDGDGGGRIDVKSNGVPVRLTRAEVSAWFHQEGPLSERIRNVSQNGEGAIVVEIV